MQLKKQSRSKPVKLDSLSSGDCFAMAGKSEDGKIYMLLTFEQEMRRKAHKNMYFIGDIESGLVFTSSPDQDVYPVIIEAKVRTRSPRSK